LVVALSGGGDSASLLAVAAALGGTFRGLPLRAVHVDHGLQPAASSFREACAVLCSDLNIPLTVVAAVVQTPPGVSLEAAAREARYAALARDLADGECLLTAHHSQDQAETLLLQALRGAGLKGMSAMPVCRPLGRGWLLRPVLEVPRDELLACGVRSSGDCAVDPMNQDLRFDRSYLRRRVWPLIETYSHARRVMSPTRRSCWIAPPRCIWRGCATAMHCPCRACERLIPKNASTLFVSGCAMRMWSFHPRRV